MKQPERRLFLVKSGEYFEDENGEARDCFAIKLRESRTVVLTHLRRNFGFGVALARNTELGMDYLVAGEADATFTEAQVMKLDLVYGRSLGGKDDGFW